ncbi:MAG: sigma-70 family RNA polymerase sigma factor [Imperialibacter sp.]|uniref:RNA polymerase sigma factor n=1 Tax=Imperialibacter sp. TaxID=2038411 RepID=UPI0032EB079B
MKRTEQQEALFIDYLESCKKLIAKVARVYCKDEEERKDLMQDITLQLWKAFPNYDDTYAVSTWTYRIALNTSISHLRKVTTRSAVQTDKYSEGEIMQVEAETTDENLEHLYRAIDLLKPVDKAIVVLQLEGCSNKEIAEVMGLSASNISTRKLRIKEELKSHFETTK